MTQLPRDLGDGPTLGAATFTDAAALATFNADVIRMQDMATPQANLGEWTRDPDCTIDAPAARVWDVLTDFAAFPRWNPFIRAIDGALAPRARLTVRIHPPGGRAVTFRPRVLRVVPRPSAVSSCRCWRPRFARPRAPASSR